MIYLILDTNNWIYLANSLDPLTNNLQEGYHFQLFEKLALKAEGKVITILVNDLVESEWTRNQNICYALISKHENRMKEDLQTIDRIGKVLQSEFHDELNKLRQAYSTQIYSEIDKNKQHIQDVSTLLESSVKFRTTNEVKVFATDWALEKKAPFNGDKKNSMADALVLFSTIKYIKDIQSEHESSSTFIFVSGNKGDFCSKTSGKSIHEDLRDLIEDAGINFFLSLPEALKFVDDALFDEIEIQDINADIDNFNLRRYLCLSCSEEDDHDGLNFVEFEPDEDVLDKTVPYVDL